MFKLKIINSLKNSNSGVGSKSRHYVEKTHFQGYLHRALSITTPICSSIAFIKKRRAFNTFQLKQDLSELFYYKKYSDTRVLYAQDIYKYIYAASKKI